MKTATERAIARQGSLDAAMRLRGMKSRAFTALPATGHMPFVGHRTQAEIHNRKRAARERIARLYGFEGW